MAEAGERLPPGFSRETTIRRDRRGRWFHDGEPVLHPKVRKAFDRWIDRADDGRYILRNDANWAYVEIEGAPIFVLRVQEDPAEGAPTGFVLHTSDGQAHALAAATLRQDRDGNLYCQVRDGRLVAQFTVRALVDLADRLHESRDGVVLEDLAGSRHPIPVQTDPLQAPPAGAALPGASP